MKLVFRPQSGYATYLKSHCAELGKSLKSNGVLRRIIDGFLLQVIRRDDNVIADVMDLPGDLFIAGLDTLSADMVLYWRPGYKLVSAEGDPYAGNMTWALMSEQRPMYSAFFEPKWLGPSKYLSSNDKPWSAAGFGYTSMGDLPTGGRYLTYTAVSRSSSQTRYSDVWIAAIKPGAPITQSTYDTSDLPVDDMSSAAGWRLLHVPLSATGIDSSHQSGEVALSSFYKPTQGYLVYFGMRYSGINGGHNDDNPQIAVALLEPATPASERGQASLRVSPLAKFGLDDLHTQDRPQPFSWTHPGPFGGNYSLLSLNGDVNSVFALEQVDVIGSPQAGQSISYDGFAMFEGLQNPEVMPWSYNSAWAEQPAVVAHADGVDVLFGVVSERPVALVSATLQHSTAFSSTQVTMDIPESRARYNHRATYLVRFGLDGSKMVKVLERSTYAVHDPEHRDTARAIYAPVLSMLADEVPLFVCVRTASAPGELSGSQHRWFRGVAPQAEDVSLEIIYDGVQVRANLGANYPVFYGANGAVAGTTLNAGYSYSKENCRYGYGSYTSRNPNIGRVRPMPVCWYAEGMIAVIAAPNDEFTAKQQVARLMVIKIEDGSLVAESEFELPFEVEQQADDYDLVQWSVTCVEQGKVENGELVTHAKLLLTEAVRGNPSFIYRADDLTTLRTVGAWGAIGELYPRGAAYYLGTPIAPALIGQSTGRSFISGKPVAP